MSTSPSRRRTSGGPSGGTRTTVPGQYGLSPGDEPAPSVTVNRAAVEVAHSGCFALVEHARHTAATLELDVGEDVVCHAVQFTPGLAS